MNHPNIPKRAIAAIQALCRVGWPSEVLIPSLLEALHGVIPSARNLFDWTDDQGQLLRYFIEGPVDTAVAQLYFQRFYNNKETICMPAFASLSRAPAGVRPASELDHANFFASDLYNEVWQPQGMHTRIEGVVRSRNGRLLGSLVLYSGPGDRRFSAADERTLEALLPMIGHALTHCPNASPAPSRSNLHVPSRESTETLLLDPLGRVFHASPGAARLMMLADQGLSREALERSLDERVTRLFGRLIEQLRQRVVSGTAGSLEPMPSLSMFNPYGRFDAQGSLLRPHGAATGDDRTLLQIVLRHLEPREVAVRRVLRDLPISVGQASVGAGLYAGKAQTEIAREMAVATSTVIDHARKLYRVLDVAGATELRDLLDNHMSTAVR